MIHLLCKMVVDLRVKPNSSSIANSAQNTANSVPDRKSYGTSTEKLSSSKEGVTIRKYLLNQIKN